MKLAKRLFVLLMALVIALPMTAMLTAVDAEGSTMGPLVPVNNECKVTLDSGVESDDKETTVKVDMDSNGKIKAPSSPFRADNPSKYAFKGWSYRGETYAAGATIPLDGTDKGSGTAKITAIWEERSTASYGSSVSSGGRIYGTFKSGIEGGASKQYSYTSGTEFTLPENPFSTPAGYTFKGWVVGSDTLKPGSTVKSDSDFTIYADWDINDRLVISGVSGSSASSVASSAASSTAPKPSSSSTAPKPSSSSTASKPVSSSSAASISTSSESSAPEVSEPEPFSPINLTYSVSGNMPITKVNLLVKEDIGGTPQLWVTSIDQYNTTDSVTGRFISDGDVLAALDLSLLLDGSTYSGAVNGTVTYTMNGTQASAKSNYGEHILAMVHVTPLANYTGTSYYMADGKKAVLYNTETGEKSEVANISFDEKDGVWRPAIGDVNSLSSFAYLGSSDTIVEVKLVPDMNAAEATIDVTSLSPILLADFELGKASAAGTGIPFWVWIIIAVVAVIVIGLVVFYFINRSNENKRLAARQERLESYAEKRTASKAESSSSVTGLDD